MTSGKVVVKAILAGMMQGAARERMRCLRSLPAGFDVSLEGLDCGLKCDVVFVQGHFGGRVAELAKRARKARVAFVYDVTDNWKLKGKPWVRNLWKHVSAVTVDTEARREHVARVLGLPVFCVPCGIDYLDSPTVSFDIRPKVESVVTFGGDMSLLWAAEYMRGLPYRLWQISDKNVNGWGFTPWRLDTFIPELVKHDVCVLAHSKDATGNMKSPARLRTAMSVGMPAVVSDTRYYREMMEEVGFPELVARRPEDVASIIAGLESVDRRLEVSRRFREFIWSRCNPKAEASEFAVALNSAVRSVRTIQ